MSPEPGERHAASAGECSPPLPRPAPLPGSPPGDALLAIRRRVLHAPLSERERPDVWAFLLRLPALDAPRYLSQLRKGRCPSMRGLGGDLSRTFNGNEAFERRVDPGALVRVLNAAAWETGGAYIQSLNLLCGTLLYVLGELRGYYAFLRLGQLCPTYHAPGLPGPRAACCLVDRVLERVDPELSRFIRARNPNHAWAFQFELSLGSSCRAFSEVLAHWDALLAFGFQLNPLIDCARVVLLRSAVFRAQNPNSVVSSYATPFPFRDCLALALRWLRDGSVPADVLQDLRMYPWDFATCARCLAQAPAAAEPER